MELLSLDSKVYSLEAVQKAAYRLIDRCAITIEYQEDHIICVLSIDPHVSTDESMIVADFQKELLDQQLRFQIKEETATARNLILSLAFSRTGLQG